MGGRTALVPLDYGSHYEHSLVYLGDRWETLRDLIAAPGDFYNSLRESFVATPNLGTHQSPVYDWELAEPITVVLESLSPASVATGQLLACLGPQAAPLMAEVRRWEDSPHDYRLAMIDACLSPNEANGQRPVHYIAEIALATRFLYVRYVPHEGVSDRLSNRITPITLSHIAGTNMSYMHFDIDCESLSYDGDPKKSESTERCRALRKAEFAMDYVEYRLTADQTPSRVDFLQRIVSREPGQKWFEAGGRFTDIGDTLEMTALGVRSEPARFLEVRSDPTVIVDSVWPDPDLRDLRCSEACADPPTSLICVLIGLLGWDANGNPVYGPGSPYYTPGQVVVKAYSP